LQAKREHDFLAASSVLGGVPCWAVVIISDEHLYICTGLRILGVSIWPCFDNALYQSYQSKMFQALSGEPSLLAREKQAASLIPVVSIVAPSLFSVLSCVPAITAICADKKASLAARIPPEWRLIPLPTATDVPNVMAIPAECGILSSKEIEMTELDNVQVLLERLASGFWTSEEVTLAVSMFPFSERIE
jgi:hypothetical protein